MQGLVPCIWSFQNPTQGPQEADVQLTEQALEHPQLGDVLTFEAYGVRHTLTIAPLGTYVLLRHDGGGFYAIVAEVTTVIPSSIIILCDAQVLNGHLCGSCDDGTKVFIPLEKA